jgi:hypothetical protein
MNKILHMRDCLYILAIAAFVVGDEVWDQGIKVHLEAQKEKSGYW